MAAVVQANLIPGFLGVGAEQTAAAMTDGGPSNNPPGTPGGALFGSPANEPQSPGRAALRPVRIAVAGEYIAGHATFFETLRAVAAKRQDLTLTLLPIHFRRERLWEKLPPVRSNWSLRASTLARLQLGRVWRDQDALLIHTQTAALFCVGLMRRVPIVISVDVTPIGYDTVGTPYGHLRRNRLLEAIKRRVVGRTFREAAAVIAWSNWTRGSLIDDYRVDPQRVYLLPAGVEIPSVKSNTTREGPVRLLFVGRDFEAKGGTDLLAALQGLDGWELDVVTLSALAPSPRVRVHQGLKPGSSELADLYSRAHALVLPSRGDSSPFAVLEGMAAGLPVISTSVGAIGEIVTEKTGLLVPPRDVKAICAALGLILSDAGLRRRMGDHARDRVVQFYNADRNANRLLDLLVTSADARECGSRWPSRRGSSVGPRGLGAERQPSQATVAEWDG